MWQRDWLALISLAFVLCVIPHCAPPEPDCNIVPVPCKGTPDASSGDAAGERSNLERKGATDSSGTIDTGGAADTPAVPDKPALTDARPAERGQPSDTGTTDTASVDGGMEPVPDQKTPPSQDECDTTAECKNKYGPSATDCVDSQSDQSYCQCGAARCRQMPPDVPPTPDNPPMDRTSPPDKPPAKTTFVEKNGYIVMEMESVSIPNGYSWRKDTSLKGYTGSGYYRFTGNNICSGPAKDPLRYSFTVVKAATFQMHLRCARIYHCVKGKPHNAKGHCGETDRTCISLGQPVNDKCKSGECIRTDISNDAFVLIEDANGKYIPFVNQPGKTVGQPIKLFGGGYNSWLWSGKRALDISGKHNAQWRLSPGAYTLVIQGRSQSFRIDRIILFDAANGTTKGAENLPETR